MFTNFEGSENDDPILEIHQTGSTVALYIYYPGEQSVGSRISFNQSDLRKVIDHLQHISLELHDEY